VWCHAGRYRIEFDVAVTGRDTATVLHKAGTKPAFPERAAALAAAIAVLIISLAKMIHE